ncbi:MAG: 50S ribosomal protein L6 [Candidatus Aenigmatarchaeota archaeon]
MKRKIDVPEDMEVEVTDTGVDVKGDGDEVNVEINHPLIDISSGNGSVVIETKKETKKTGSISKTFESKIENAIKGIKEGYEYKLKVIYKHFPMEVREQGNKLVVSNFLGEKKDREADILDGVEVEVDGEDIFVRGADKDKVGQTAANIERDMQAPNKKDRRVFEDGIYIVEKPSTEN